MFGNGPVSWGEQVENYINGKIRKGEDVQLLTEDGDVLTLTKAEENLESIPADVREALGINERFPRISIGIENPKDIIADLERGFAALS